jgi:DNA-binding GntR family transcriptional regulator
MSKLLLKDQAYDAIKARILDGEFATGAFLSERTLAERLGMSKTPIRTALERLELERFVTISPQQGIVVRELSLQEIRDHYDIRLALESFVVRRLAGRLTTPQIEALESNIETMRRLVDRGHRADAMYTDADFHQLLCTFLNNQEISRVMRHQREKLYRVILQLQERNPERLQHTLSEHTAIVSAMKQGDGERAAAEMQRHLNNGRQLLVTS